MWHEGETQRISVEGAEQRRSVARGFTLVEILIVVIILGILAAIVIPQFSNASQTARESTLRDDLRFLRSQTQVYKAQHLDYAPGYDAATHSTASEADWLAQMTGYTSASCGESTSATSTYEYGPYLSRMPADPLNDQSTTLVIADGQPMPDPTSLPLMNGTSPYGWIYKPQTQEFMANIAGSDNSGVAYSSY